MGDDRTLIHSGVKLAAQGVKWHRVCGPGKGARGRERGRGCSGRPAASSLLTLRCLLVMGARLPLEAALASRAPQAGDGSSGARCAEHKAQELPWSAAVATGVPLEGGLGHVVTLLPVRDLTTWDFPGSATMGRRRVQTPGRSAHI